MTAPDTPRRLRGGAWGPVLVVLFVLVAVTTFALWATWTSRHRAYGSEIPFDRAMFSAGIEQPIAFSHRLHVSDKQIDCRYCHATVDRSPNAGLPSAQTCLGCHEHIIPQHEEIAKLKGYWLRGEEIPWERVYFNPDHVSFPHDRHLGKDVECQECHGSVEQVDRLRKVTFYMGFCLECHAARNAPRTCTACHQ
jgi:hypothetical protein